MRSVLIIVYPPDLRYDEDIFSPDRIDISIRYVTIKSPNNIYMSEDYSSGVNWQMTPRANTTDCFFEINGVEVLESSIMVPVKIGEQTLQPLYSYEWLLEGVHFFVDIEGYDQSESRRIVESMFK